MWRQDRSPLKKQPSSPKASAKTLPNAAAARPAPYLVGHRAKTGTLHQARYEPPRLSLHRWRWTLELRRPASSISPPVFQRLLWYDWRKTSSGQQRNSSLAQKYPAHQI